MNKSFASTLIHSGSKTGKSVSHSKALPIYQTSVFSFDDVETLEQVYDNQAPGYIYTRNGNPNHDALNQIMHTIEEGEAALSYSSGMAAISLAIIANVQAGDHIIAANVLYGGSFMFLKSELARFNVEVTFADPLTDDLTPLFRPNTKAVYIETISNPIMEAIDIPLIAEITHHHKAKLIVDNSFATPIICQPLKLGADIVVYSATKYLGGHSDITAGIVVANTENIQQIYASGLLFGPTLSPFDSWLLARSLRTLELRIRQHSQNAQQLAHYFSSHPKIAATFYPGLPSSPTHAIAKRLYYNNLYGGMMSIELLGGEKSVRQLFRTLETIKFVPSLAGVATTTSYPAKTSHRALSDEELRRAGISKGLVRISVGLEDADYIIDEFERGLRGI
jgi:methionine-gamma-lyase